MTASRIRNYEKYLEGQISQSNKSAEQYKSFKKLSRIFKRDAEVFESALIAFRFIKAI